MLGSVDLRLNSGRTAVAFSGGGDSLAVLAGAVDGRFGPLPDFAFIVDHGLRPGSDCDARVAAGMARELGVEPVVLRWDGGARGSRAHAAARRGRHGLLAAACRARGVRRLLLGHTADDQLETALMRLARPRVSARALAGLWPSSPAPSWPDGRDLILVRPVLDRSRADLRGMLRQLGLDWLEDPANGARVHERVRARHCVAGWSDAHRSQMLRSVQAAQRLARVVDCTAWARLADVVVDAFGRLSLGLEALLGAPDGAAHVMLDALLDGASGTPRARSVAGRARVQEAVARGRDATFSGVLVRCLSRGGEKTVVFARDRGVLHGRADGGGARDGERHLGLISRAVAAGEGLVWDGRFDVAPVDRDRIVHKGENGAPVVHFWEGGVCDIKGESLARDLIVRRLFTVFCGENGVCSASVLGEWG